MKRNNSRQIKIYLMLILTFILSLPCQSQQNKSLNENKSFSVEIKFSNGTTKIVEEFRRVIISWAMYSEIRIDVPQTTYTDRYNLSVNIGPYEVEIPFEIIKKISFEIKKGPNVYTKYPSAKVLLGNNTEIEGRIWGQFKGKTSLGESTYKIVDDDIMSLNLNITEIVFNHNPLTNYNITSFGKHKLDLYQINGVINNLYSAGFMKEKVNENGCYLADEYAEQIEFKVKGEGDYKIEWDKIASLVHENPVINLYNNFLDYSHTYKLFTKDGTEHTGSCQTWTNAVHYIKGLTNINNDYNLLISIPLFRNWYSKLVFKE